MNKLALAGSLAALAFACTPVHHMANPRKASMDPVELRDGKGVEDALGRLVRFSGTAQNAKRGAVVTGGDGMVVYCEGLEAWPEAVVGKKVVVSGLLTRTDELKAAVEADGAVGQGTAGGDYLLKHPKVE